jgi:hypothetical protein
MLTPPCAGSRRPARFGTALRLLLLGAVILAQAGCATTDADLDYTRDKPTDEVPKDHSYHGWNDNNY